MGKLPKPYLSRSMNNIVVLSLGIIAVFFLYRYIKSLENDIIKLRIEMDEMSSKRAPPPLPSGGSVKLATAAFPAPLNTNTEEQLAEDDESIRSEDLTCMLRAVLVNDGIACVNMQEEPAYDTDKVEVCETEEEENQEEADNQEEAEESERSTAEKEEEVNAESIPSENMEELNPKEIRDILSGKTCEQLRSLLKERGIENLKGKKAELVERIMSS